METNFNKNIEEYELQKMASKKVVKLRSFYRHLIIYVIGVLIFISKEYFGAPLNFFPIKHLNLLIMGVWTVFLVVTAIDLFASYKIFGEEWEERKVKSILEKKSKTQKWE